jgi:hypothetical protein
MGFGFLTASMGFCPTVAAFLKGGAGFTGFNGILVFFISVAPML